MSLRLLRNIPIHTDTSDHYPPSTRLAYRLEAVRAPEPLTPIQLPKMNSLNGTSDSPQQARTPNGTTIRAVPAEPLQIEPSSISNDDSRRYQSRSDSATSSTSKSYGNVSNAPPLSWQNNRPVSNGLVRSISTEFGPVKGFPNSNTSTSSTEDVSSSANGLASPTNSNPQWSAAVGRANLGKSGRVIERLMGENDMLKRDIKLERLRAEESKQAVKMIETKLESMSAGLEREIQEAAFNGLQLKRRDRQLAEARAEVEYERHRALEAGEREKAWKDQLVQVQESSTRDVALAKERVLHLEASYGTVRSHWSSEKAKLNKGVTSMRKEIEIVVLQRQKDDGKMTMLGSVGDQQAVQILELQRKNEAIQRAFDEYKEEQERGLHGIKTKARELEDASDETLEQSKKTLGELKWALGVKRNVKDAQ